MADNLPSCTSAPARLPWRLGTVALLLLACFVPRAIAAWNWDVLWSDSLHYYYASVALEQGDFRKGLYEFGLNIYPLLLIPLRHLSVDWQIAGKWFSVVMATLTVVPLWAWLRRMFDDRLALLACLVYALNGKLITNSPLIIRDPTFWFVMTTTLYFLWRAVTEARLAYFLAGGLALTLAVHTRTEGWLLLVPLVGWTACRCVGSASRAGLSKMHCRRLVLGALACLAVLPVSLVVVNSTWLREHPYWQVLRRDHSQMLMDLLAKEGGTRANSPDPDEQSLVLDLLPDDAAPPSGKSPSVDKAPNSTHSPSPPVLTPVPPPPEPKMSRWTLAFKLLERVAKGLTWVGGLLLLIGIFVNWRTFLWPEHLVLLAMNLVLLAGSGLRYQSFGLDLRYFLPIAIIGAPWMALGAEFLVNIPLRVVRRFGEPSPITKSCLTGTVIAVLVLCSLFDAPLPGVAFMYQHSAMGRWIGERGGAAPTLAGNLNRFSLETFYAGGKAIGFVSPSGCLGTSMPKLLLDRKADFVVFWKPDEYRPEHVAAIVQRMTDYCGYRHVSPQELQSLPPGGEEVMVFERK